MVEPAQALLAAINALSRVLAEVQMHQALRALIMHVRRQLALRYDTIVRGGGE